MSDVTNLRLETNAAGVLFNGRFYPWKFSYATLPAKMNVRYYVHRLIIGGLNVGVHAAHTTSTVQMTLDDAQGPIPVVTTHLPPLPAADSWALSEPLEYSLELLGEINTPVTVGFGYDYNNIFIRYAEIDDKVSV